MHCTSNAARRWNERPAPPLASSLTPAQMDALVTERTTVIGKAKAMLGDRIQIDGKTIGDVRRMVVDHVMKDGAKGWDDNQVRGASGPARRSVDLPEPG